LTWIVIIAALALGALVAISGCRGAGGSGSGKLDVVNWDYNHKPSINDAPAAFEAAGCGTKQCHGSMTAGGGAAPDLSHIGSKHNSSWIGDQIREPTKHNPNSKMPAYNDSKMLYVYQQAVATALSNQK